MTAIVSAVVGMIGGTLLLAVMAQFLKMEVLIPIHGCIQLFSNSTRAWFLRTAINWPVCLENLVGVAIGSVLGAFYVVRMPEHLFNLILGIFIVSITLFPKFTAPLKFRGRFAALGLVTSFIGLFVGAVGVLVGSVFLSEHMEKKEMIGTQGVCQALLHLAKILVFMTLGFVIRDWLTLLTVAIVMTYLGAWVGTRLLEKIPEKVFRRVLTALILTLALRLIWVGLVT